MTGHFPDGSIAAPPRCSRFDVSPYATPQERVVLYEVGGLHAGKVFCSAQLAIKACCAVPYPKMKNVSLGVHDC